MSQVISTALPNGALCAPIALHRPWWDRAASALLDTAEALLAGWRRHEEQDRIEQSLAAVDTRTLRDVGLGEFASRREAALLAETRLARW